MTAIEIIEHIMSANSISFKELAEYSDLGSRENVYQMLQRSDLKVGTFFNMLEAMGYQIIVQNVEDNEEDIVVEY